MKYELQIYYEICSQAEGLKIAKKENIVDMEGTVMLLNDVSIIT